MRALFEEDWGNEKGGEMSVGVVVFLVWIVVAMIWGRVLEGWSPGNPFTPGVAAFWPVTIPIFFFDWLVTGRSP